MDPILKQTLDWYLSLCSRPGWADYGIDQARELAMEHSVFEALPKLLLKANPALSQMTLGRSQETRANTFRIPPGYRKPMQQKERR